jgi:Dolichyl-phosphate-mannose-protein mannosyltransferase
VACNLFHSRKRLLLLLALVLCTRLLFALVIWKTSGAFGFFRADTPQYVKPAESLLHGSFSSSGVFSPENTPETSRTPGYPLLLLPGITLHHLVLVGIVENLLLAVASAWLVWLIADEFFPATSAPFWAVLLYCFEPVGLVYTNTLMSDTAFNAGILLFLWLFICYLHRPLLSKLMWAAMVLGITTYVRPVTLYLALLLSVMLLVLNSHPITRKTGNWKERVIGAVLFPVLFAVMLAPWLVRNFVVADYRGLSSTQEWGLYFVTAGAIQAKVEHRSVSQAVDAGYATTPEQYLSLHPEQRSWSEGAKARFWRKEATTAVKSHPGIFAEFYAKNCASILLNPAVTEVLRETGLYPTDRTPLDSHLDQGYLSATMWLVQQHPVVAILIPAMVLQLLLYYVLAVLGLRHMSLEIRVFFIALCFYFVLISAVFTAGARYRAPFMPLVCIAAGAGIANWRGKARLTTDQH